VSGVAGAKRKRSESEDGLINRLAGSQFNYRSEVSEGCRAEGAGALRSMLGNDETRLQVAAAAAVLPIFALVMRIESVCLYGVA
jgi:hypothetical protein